MNNEKCCICFESLSPFLSQAQKMQRLHDGLTTKFDPKLLNTKLCCGHEFHKKCIEKWLETSTSCPICRKECKRKPVLIIRIFYPDDTDTTTFIY